MEIHPVRTEQDYRSALAEVSALVEIDPALGTMEADRLEVIGLLVEAYERKHYSIAAPDPIEAIRFRMDQMGLEIADLEPMIGQRNRVYEVLARKRPLTLAMIRRLHKGLDIPAAALIGLPDDSQFIRAA